MRVMRVTRHGYDSCLGATLQPLRNLHSRNKYTSPGISILTLILSGETSLKVLLCRAGLSSAELVTTLSKGLIALLLTFLHGVTGVTLI